MAEDGSLDLPFGADIRLLEAQLNRAVNTLNRSMDKMETRTARFERTLSEVGRRGGIDKALDKVFDSSRLAVLDEGSARLRVFGSALEPLGAAGIAAAAGIAGVAIAFERASKAADWAEDLERVSKSLGLTTTELQEFDFVAQASGIGIDKMRETLRGLGTVIGQVQDNTARGKIARGVFAAILGDKPAEVPAAIRHLGDIQHILPVVLDYMSKLSATQRLGLSKTLKVDPEAINSLIDAKDSIGGLIEQAHRYGIVVDEDVIKKSAEAAKQMHIAKTVIDDELRAAFLTLAPAAAGAATKLVSVVTAIADVINGARRALQPIADLIGALDKIPGFKAVAGTAGGLLNPLSYLPGASKFVAIGQAEQRRREADDRQKAEDEDKRRTDPTLHRQDATVVIPDGGGRHRRGRADHSGTEIGEAQERYVEALIRGASDLDEAHKFHLQLIDLQFDVAKARAGQETNPKTRATLIKTAGLTHDADIVDETKRDAEARATASRRFAAGIEKLTQDVDAAHTRAREAADREDEGELRGLGYEGDRLRALEGIATTQKEREALAKQILANEQAQATIELRKQGRDEGFDTTPGQAALDAAGKAKGVGIDRQFDGPLADFARGATDTSIGDQLQSNAVSAMQTLNSGVIDLLNNSKDAKKELKDLPKKFALDFAKQILERGEGGLISGLQSAGAKPGGGSFFSSLSSFTSIFKLFGFAAGTGAGGAPGGLALIGEHGPELANVPRGTSITPNHSLSSLLNSASLRSTPANMVVSLAYSIDARGNSGDQAVQSWIANAFQRSKADTFDAVRRAMPGMQSQYQYEKG